MLKAEEYYLLATDITTKYAARNNEFVEMRRMCGLDWRMENDTEGAIKVVDVTPFVAIEHAVGVLTKNVPSLVVELADEDYIDKGQLDIIQNAADFDGKEQQLEQLYAKGRKRADAAAEKLENIEKGIWRATQYDQRVDLLQKTIREYYGPLGWFCFKTLYNGAKAKDSATSLQPDKNGPCRYVIQTRDPSTVYPKDGPFGPLYVVEKYTRFVRDVQKAWPKVKLTQPDGKPADPNAEVEWMEYWDDEVKIFWAGDKVVLKPTLHGYGFTPYVIYQGHSFLWPLYQAGVWTANNQLMSMSMTHALHYVNSAYVFESIDGSTAEVDLSPGGLTTINVQEKIYPLQRALTPGDMLPLLERMELQNQRVGFTAQAYGEASAQSGYGTALLLHGTEVKLVSQLTTLSMGLGRVFLNLAKLLKKFPPRGLRIYGATDKLGNKVRMFEANGDDIPDNPIIEVLMKPLLPQDRMQQATLATMLVDKALMSRQQAQTKYIEIDSVVEEDQRIKQDLVEMSPEMIKVHSQTAALVAQAEQEPIVLQARLNNARKVLELKKELAEIQKEISGLDEEPPAPPGMMQPGMETQPPNPQELEGGGQPPAPAMPMPAPSAQPYAMTTGNAPVPPDGGAMENLRASLGVLPPRPQQS